MCKHILINDFKPQDLAVISQFSEMTHDKDGFGAIAKLHDNTIVTLKSVNIAEFYLNLGQLISINPIKTLVVHHRTSTNELGIDYAHPFEFQGNYLTHNGVVSVPGNHETKTKNDSEALLHHLIKSNFETVTIQGYFSVFLLNATETRVLVDDTAPLYTDGRVYCSHKLSDSFVPISMRLLSLDIDSGAIISSQPIIVSKSNYGLELAHKSIGPYPDFFENDYAFDSSFDQFMSYLTLQDEYWVLSSKNTIEASLRILELAERFGVSISDEDKNDILQVINF